MSYSLSARALMSSSTDIVSASLITVLELLIRNLGMSTSPIALYILVICSSDIPDTSKYTRSIPSSDTHFTRRVPSPSTSSSVRRLAKSVALFVSTYVWLTSNTIRPLQSLTKCFNNASSDKLLMCFNLASSRILE